MDPGLPPPADGVLEAALATASAWALSSAAVEFVPGLARRFLAASTSRERSPRGDSVRASASPLTSSSQVPASASAGTARFAEGQAVLLADLVSRPELVGKGGVVQFFDSATSRYAVCIDASGEMVRVREGNLTVNIFKPPRGDG